MSNFVFKSALKKLGYSKEAIENGIRKPSCPVEYAAEDFLECFLNHLTIIGDSREQNDWIEKACNYYGIAFEKAVKDKKAGTENLKEGDYTFEVRFGDRIISYRGVVAYERKGSLSEISNNLKSGDRDRIEREFERFIDKGYKKVVLVLEYGCNMSDLLDGKFEFIDHNGMYQDRNVSKLVYASLMSWKQPNAFGFEIYQNTDHFKTFWWMVTDMFYYFRNDIKNAIKRKESEENEQAN